MKIVFKLEKKEKSSHQHDHNESNKNHKKDHHHSHHNHASVCNSCSSKTNATSNNNTNSTCPFMTAISAQFEKLIKTLENKLVNVTNVNGTINLIIAIAAHGGTVQVNTAADANASVNKSADGKVTIVKSTVQSDSSAIQKQSTQPEAKTAAKSEEKKEVGKKLAAVSKIELSSNGDGANIEETANSKVESKDKEEPTTTTTTTTKEAETRTSEPVAEVESTIKPDEAAAETSTAEAVTTTSN